MGTTSGRPAQTGVVDERSSVLPGAAGLRRRPYPPPAKAWGRSAREGHWIDAEAADRTDRQVSQLISLGGVALILGQGTSMIAAVGEFAPWWNAVAALPMAQILIFAAFGSVLPVRWLRLGWIAAPPLNAVVLFAAYAAYTGQPPASVLPWPWAFEAAIVSYLVLTVRPYWAVAGTIASALLPALSAVVFLGEMPHDVLTMTPIHLANLIYIALFGGIRSRLNQLRDAEARALAAEAQRVRAEVSARDQEQLARLVHDEVLSVLTAAAHFRGTPPPVLRADASEALALFDRPAFGRGATPCDTRQAADQLAAALRRLEPSVKVECAAPAGDIPGDVIETITAAAVEALRNSLRHAPSAERTVSASVSAHGIEVLVDDQGPGFDIAQLGSSHLGVRQSILARMRALPGGGVVVDSAPGNGTRVRLTWRT